MSNTALGHNKKKIQLHKIHTMFCHCDRGQNSKRSLTLCAGSNFQVDLISMKMGSKSNWIIDMIQERYSNIALQHTQLHNAL